MTIVQFRLFTTDFVYCAYDALYIGKNCREILETEHFNYIIKQPFFQLPAVIP